MSQTESNRKIYTVNKWYGGMSNDEYVGPDGCFYDGEGIEIRRNSKEITLNRDPLIGNADPLTLTGGTNAGAVTCFHKYYDTLSTYTFFCGTENGKVFDVSARTVSTFTMGGGYPILTIGVIQDMATSGGVMTGQPGANRYGFLIDARGALYRWTWTNASDGGLLGTAYNAANIMNPGAAYSTNLLGPGAPYIITNNSLIYGCANLIYVFDLTKSPWALATPNPIVIDRGYTVKAITKIDSQIIIYTANDTVVNTTTGWNGVTTQGGANGKVYYYSYQSLITGNPPDRTIDWKDKPILAVASRSNIDFVVAGSPYRRALYRNDGGYSPTLLFQSPISNSTSGRFYFNPLYGSNSVGAYGNLIMLPASEKLYTYGTVTNGLPDSLVKELVLTNYTPTCYFVDETSTGARLYIGAKKNSETFPSTTVYFYAPYLNIRGANDYVTGGYVTINPSLGEGVFEKKRLVKVNIAYNLEANTSISLYSTLDDGTETLLGTTGVGGGYGRTTFVTNTYADFYKVSFRAVLNTTNATKTPHLFSLQFVYDVLEDEMT